MTASLTPAPSTPAPSTNVTITGAGFADAKTRLKLDGVVVGTNDCSLPSGTFTHAITVASVAGTQTITAEQYTGGAWSLAATTTVTVTVPSVPPPSTGAYPTDRAYGYLRTPLIDQPRPGYLVEVTDATWGTKVRRITNTNGWRNNYSGHQSWNLDGSRIMFPGYGGHIFNGTTYADLGAMSSWAAFPCWSNVNADYAYGVRYDSNKVRRYSVSGNSWSDRHTFGSYDYLDLGGYAGNISDNDRMSLMAYSGSNTAVVVYDAANDAVISTLSTGTTSLNSCQMSRSGAYFYVNFTPRGTGANQGTKLYNASTGALIRTITPGSPHCDMGRDAAGNDIFVYVSESGYTAAHNCATGVDTQLTKTGDFYSLNHVSCTNYARPGWTYLSSSSYSSSIIEGNGMIAAVKTDGSMIVEVFASHHNGSNTSYDTLPFASANRDGTLVTWGGPWGGNPATDTYGFVAGVTT